PACCSIAASAPRPIRNSKRSGPRAARPTFGPPPTPPSNLPEAAGWPETASNRASSLRESRYSLGERLRREARICSVALRRISQARARRDKAETLATMRDWQHARRARTRLLIEYGGLVVKA